MKLLVYTDGRPQSAQALACGAELSKKLDADLSVITVRPGTPAGEPPPPVGDPVAWQDRAALPRGLRLLTDAAVLLADSGIIDPLPSSVTIQDTPKGHLFGCTTTTGRRVAFYECFGNLVEVLNKEVDAHGYELLIIAPMRRSRLGRWVVGDVIRKLTLDLHTSLLVVRGGKPNGRFLVCCDGTPAARRPFLLLKSMLPAIEQPVDLIYVRLGGRPGQMDEQAEQTAQKFLEQARAWLDQGHKAGRILIKEGKDPAALIGREAGDNATIVVGASLRHDVYRRMLGSFPMQVIESTACCVLLVKAAADPDADFF